MAADVAALELREHGVAVLRDLFAADRIDRLRAAATKLFDSATCPSHNSLLATLLRFGCDPQDLKAPDIGHLVLHALGREGSCHMDQSWVRKKFAPHAAPGLPYHPQDWHQDGALGVRFPDCAGQPVPMTQLLTCWIPLQRCGQDSPGLEFICCPQPALLHYTELQDAALRRRFPPEKFQAPVLEPGDGFLFLNGTLHRSYTHPAMRHNRISVEYRFI